MNLLESQNILLASLKFFGFFPIKFPGKYRKLKNHLYNFVVSIGLITTFAIIGRVELNHILDSSTEKESNVAYLVALIEIFSEILCFAIIKLYLLLKNGVVKNYYEKLRDLETTWRSFHSRNKKIDQIIEDLRVSNLQQEIFLYIFHLVSLIGFGFCAVSDVLMFTFDNFLYMVFNCFFVQILIFLKMNMIFASRLQSHLNQVLINLQKFNLLLNPEDFLEIHRKIKQFLLALNRVFGFIFFFIILGIFGCMIPENYIGILTLVQDNSKVPIKTVVFVNLNFIWVVFSYYHFVRFAFECDKMEEEMSRFSEVLSNVRDKEVGNALANYMMNIKIFFLIGRNLSAFEHNQEADLFSLWIF
jgi:hypothetical protein